MDIEKLAREAGACELFGRDLALMGRESIARLIEAVRRETAEEAAKFVEDQDDPYDQPSPFACAAAIRERFKA